MAFTTEEQTLVMRVEGQLDVDRLRQSIFDEELAVRKAIEGHRAGTLSLGAYEAQVRQSTAALQQHNRDLVAAQSATRDYKINIQAAGYALNDFLTANGGLAQQINSVSNNIPGMLSGLGNIGPILSGLLPLGVLLAANWDNLRKMMVSVEETATDRLERIKEAISELEKQPVKLAVDIHELEILRGQLDDIERAIKQVDALRHSQTVEERESGKSTGDAIENAEGGAQGVLAAVRPGLIKEAMAASQTIRDADQKAADARAEIQAIKAGKYAESLETALVKGAEAASAIKEAEETRRRAQTEIAKEGGSADQMFGKMLEAAKNGAGDTQRTAQKQLADLLNARGKGDLADEIRGASPAAILEKHIDEAVDKGGEVLQEIRDANDKLVDTLNDQGRGATDEFFKARNSAVAKENEEVAESLEKRAKAAKERQERLTKTTEGLGNEFLASAEDQQLEIAQMPQGTKSERTIKAQAQRRFESAVQAEVQKRLVAQGVEPGLASEASSNFGGFVNADIQRQADLFRAMNPGASRAETARSLRAAFQAQSATVPQGGGLRSIPAVDPNQSQQVGQAVANRDAALATALQQGARTNDMLVGSLNHQAAMLNSLANTYTKQAQRVRTGRSNR